VSNRVVSEQQLAQWQRPVASSKVMDLLHWVMRSVSYRRIAMVIEMASKEGIFCMVVLLIVALAAAGVIQSE